MDREATKVKKVIDNYIEGFPSNFRVEGVFLFGSCATGKAKEDSDIDLVIISSDFKGIDFLKRLEFLSALRSSNMTRSVSMDIIGYTPQEFENIEKESIVMRRAKREGKMVYSGETV